MIQQNLASFYGSFYSRTNSLLRDFLLASPFPPTAIGGIPVETILHYSRGFLINRLFHLWGEFCRHVVVASALGGYRTLGGITLPGAPQIRSVSDILTTIQAQSIVGPGLRWGDPRWTTNKIGRIQPANLQQITLGVGAAPYDEFRRVRNFVIHSNPHTRLEFDAVTVTYSLMGVSADDLLLHRLPGGGTVMEGWVRDFQVAALNTVR